MTIQETDLYPNATQEFTADIQNTTKENTKIIIRGISLNLRSTYGGAIALAGGEVARHSLHTDVNPAYCLYMAAVGVITAISMRRLYIHESQLIQSTQGIKNNNAQDLIETVRKMTEPIKELQNTKANGGNYDQDYLDTLISERDEIYARIREINARNKAGLNKPASDLP